MQIKMHNFACECKRHTKTVPVKLGDVRKRGKKWVMTVSRSSRNVLAILSKKQEIAFTIKKVVFNEEKYDPPDDSIRLALY